MLHYLVSEDHNVLYVAAENIKPFFLKLQLKPILYIFCTI